VRYEFDGGARFVVTLPRVVDAEPRPERPKPPADPSTGRILLAEDEPLVRHVLTLVLRRAGHDVVVATDGYEAERALSEDRFDLAILDISMPGPSGLDLLHRFKTAAQPMRIALLSGFVPDSAVTADADAVIWKPVNPEDLRKSVRDLLAMR
jgi:CheY-like chemotaxis protein